MEKVLVIPADLVIDGGHFANSPLLTGEAAVALAARLLAPENMIFVERRHAETDPDFLQVIPYVVVWRGREIFQYRRGPAGGEERLHGKLSIGVGGHIAETDAGPTRERQCYERAMRREVKEETGIDMVSAPVVGIIYDPSDAVGRVHLGIVHYLTVGMNTTPAFSDPAVASGSFMHATEFRNNSKAYESWSKLIIEGLL